MGLSQDCPRTICRRETPGNETILGLGLKKKNLGLKKLKKSFKIFYAAKKFLRAG